MLFFIKVKEGIKIALICIFEALADITGAIFFSAHCAMEFSEDFFIVGF